MSAPLVESSTARGARAVRRALFLRVASAGALIPPTLFAVWQGGRLFVGLVAFAAMIMVFEWTRMTEGRAYGWRFYALSAGAGAALIVAATGRYPESLAIAFAVGAATVVGPATSASARFWPAVAAPYVIAPSIALLWLRQEPENGRILTALIFGTVWAADTGAFITGKLVGGPKISHALSPSKTWAGIGGGVAGGAIIGAGLVFMVYGAESALAYLLPGGMLGAASVGGDLAESAFKRHFGVKDISGVIPGHGGVLDRLDGMIFATLAMTSVYLFSIVFEKG